MTPLSFAKRQSNVKIIRHRIIGYLLDWAAFALSGVFAFELRFDFVLPAEETSNVGEGCATVTWLQLTWQLLRLTGEPQYAEQLEHTVYNALLGAQDPRTGDICYFTPLNGKKSPTPGINCCVSSEPRGISMIPQLAWGSRAGGVAVLFYVPGRVTVDGITIDVKTPYPAEGSAVLTVNPAKAARFPLFLRVPAWTARFAATAGGQTYQGAPGQFLAIEREWKPGDRVELTLDMPIHRVLANDAVEDDRGRVALERGPIVFCAEGIDNGGHALALYLPDDAPLSTEFRGDLFRGVQVITGTARALKRGDDNAITEMDHPLVAIPNYAWGHRGDSDMAVWMARAARPVRSALDISFGSRYWRYPRLHVRVVGSMASSAARMIWRMAFRMRRSYRWASPDGSVRMTAASSALAVLAVTSPLSFLAPSAESPCGPLEHRVSRPLAFLCDYIHNAF